MFGTVNAADIVINFADKKWEKSQSWIVQLLLHDY
jgi:hypothetical protein